MGYTHGIKVNEEFLKAHPEFKCEVPAAEIEVENWYVEKTTDWSFANRNCLLKYNVEMNVTKDVNSLYD